MMSEAAPGTPVPDLSIEVDDVDAIHDRARSMELPEICAYDLTDEPWGVRQFFLADPTGEILSSSTQVEKRRDG
ncbi:MAG: hypothetical protein R3D63_02625 [Paracoccaceae bacterium]